MSIISVEFESDLTSAELHELLCTAIHESDGMALVKLTESVADIKTAFTSVESAIEYLLESFDIPLQSCRLRAADQIRNILFNHSECGA